LEHKQEYESRPVKAEPQLELPKFRKRQKTE
jgi:hypothetical protein